MAKETTTESTAAETTLTDDEKKQKSDVIYAVYSEALNSPKTIKNQQKELKNVRFNRDFEKEPLTKQEHNFLNGNSKEGTTGLKTVLQGAGIDIDGLSDVDILKTCRRAVEEKALQTFRDTFKATLTPEKAKEIEQQMRAFDLKPRKKGKPVTLSEEEIKERKEAQKAFVNELQTAFSKEQGYALWGGNGNILKAVRETIGEYKKENGLDKRDDRSDRKDDTRRDKPKKEGERDMADDKEMDLAEALKVYKKAYGMAQADKPDAGATKQMYAALDIMLSDAEKDHEASKKAYEALMKAEEDKLKSAVESLEDGEFKDGALGALYAHKNRDKFRASGIPEEEWADITSAEKYNAWMAAHPLKPREEDTSLPDPITDENWVKEKAEWYKRYNAQKHFADFQITRQDDQFEVKFEGGTIHYESKENVSISVGAKYKVYEALLREDHNKDRPVQFPADASEHLTSMLYAASILNETSENKPHEMIGVDKTKINMGLIETQLRQAGYGDEDIKKVRDYYDAHEGKPTEEHTDEHSSGDEHRGADEGPTRPEVQKMAETNNYTISKNDHGHVIIEAFNEENKSSFTMDYNPTDGKYTYTMTETKETTTDIEDKDALFLKGKAEGFLSIQSDLDLQIKLAKIEAANGGKLTPENGKELQESRTRLVEAYGKDPALFRRAMGNLISNTTVESKEHEDLRAAQIAMLRAKAEKNDDLKKHDETVQKRETARDRLLVLRGIKSNDDGKILGEDGKPVQTDKTLAKELSDNLKEFSEAKAKDKNLTLEGFMTEKYKDKGLNKDEMSAKIKTQATYNLQVEKYGKPQTTR